MYKIYSIVTLFYLIVSLKIKAEVFSSNSKIELLLTTQKNVIDTLNHLIKNKNNRNKILKNHLSRFEFEHQTAMVDIRRYIGNPFNSYRLIKRLTVDLKLIEKILIKVSDDYKRNESLTYPSKEDLKGAVEGITHLGLYDYNKTDMASGLWNTTLGNNRTAVIETFNPMTISDCYQLSKILYNFKMYAESVVWAMEARRKYNDEWRLYPEDEHIRLEDIITLANTAYTRDQQEKSQFQNWLKQISPNFKIPDLKRNQLEVLFSYFKNGFKVSEVLESIKARLGESLNEMNLSYQNTFKCLCKGEVNNQQNVYHKGKCYMAHGPHPFLKLAPIKTEILSRAPLLMLFHNVISDSEIEELKNHSSPKLKRAPISYFKGNTFAYEYSRTCQAAEIIRNELVTATRIISKIEQFLGMDLSAAIRLEVVNYGIGGHCALHTDSWYDGIGSDYFGRRISTTVFYLSDVELGGATVFPKLNTAVMPEKGAALFWKNLLPSGEGDPNTLHAGCPVLRGSKWLLNFNY